MALTEATLVRDVKGQPWRFSSVEEMKAFSYNSYTGDTVFLESWHEGVGLGSGLFKVSKGSEEPDDGGSVIVANDGTRLLRIFDGGIYADMWGAYPSDTFNSYPALKAAYAYASSKMQQLFVGGGSYKVIGDTSLDINPSHAGISAIGRVRLDASEFTGDYLFTITSTYSYLPAPLYNNLSPALDGFYVVGSRESGRSGLLIGRRTKDGVKSYNGQTEIRNCTFDKFDYNIRMGHNSWRFVFYKVNSLNALNPNGILYAPSGLDDSGEILTFYHCQFFDGAGSNIRISCASFTMLFVSCSFLNITFFVDAPYSTSITCQGCNFENPGSQDTRRYIDIAGGHTNLFNIVGGSIVTNSNAGQTQALINISEGNQLNLSNITIPYGGHYKQEEETGYHAFCSGGGAVSAVNCGYQLRNGSGCCPIHPSLSLFSNWNLGMGNMKAWTADTDSGGGSASYVAGAGPKGAGVMRVVPGSRPVNVSQVATVPLLSGSFSMSVMVNVQSASGNAGQISVTYFDEYDNRLGGVSANLGSSTGWMVIGKNTLRGRLPIGARKMKVNIQTAIGATVDYTNILCNVI
jgi:hypothetical protein